MKRFTSLLLCVMLLFANFCIASPLPKKEETVYVNLDDYGNVNQINIYSKWITNGIDSLQDKTNYLTVSNLTNRNNYYASGDSIIWNTSGESTFAYTGQVGEEYYDKLPWQFDISYFINGVESTADELLGASGLIKIIIDIKANNNTNDYYKNNYLLEITSTFDMNDYLSVNSKDAMITDTGNSKTLMFVVLPGQSTTVELELGSNDFSMDGITMAMVPITGDIHSKIIDLIEEREEIRTALDSINESADIVLNATNGMTSGLTNVSNGISSIKSGIKSIHGLDNLRDSDIQELKKLLEELLPIMQSVQDDIDNLNKSYDTFIELNEKLNQEIHELTSDIDNLNDNFEKLNNIIKKIPGDVEDIQELLDITAKVVGSTNTLIQSLSSSSDDGEEIEKDLKAIGTQTATIGTIVQQTVPNVSDEEAANALLEIGDSASSIQKHLISVSETLDEMSSSGMAGTSALGNNLKKLKNELENVSENLSKKDAQKFYDFTKSLEDTSYTLEKMVNTIYDYQSKLLENKDDFKTSTEHIKLIINELNNMNILANNMLTNSQNILNIVSTEIYQGTNTTADALISVNNQMKSITSQSDQIKKSKDDVKKVIDNKRDDIESETTIFNMEKEPNVVSFGSSENENVDDVQFVIKTPDIKQVKHVQEDLEKENDEISFWDKVAIIFQKIWAWITGIFS